MHRLKSGAIEILKIKGVVTYCMLALFPFHGREDIMAVLEMNIQQVLRGKVFVAISTPMRM